MIWIFPQHLVHMTFNLGWTRFHPRSMVFHGVSIAIPKIQQSRLSFYDCLGTRHRSTHVLLVLCRVRVPSSVSDRGGRPYSITLLNKQLCRASQFSHTVTYEDRGAVIFFLHILNRSTVTTTVRLQTIMLFALRRAAIETTPLHAYNIHHVLPRAHRGGA